MGCSENFRHALLAFTFGLYFVWLWIILIVHHFTTVNKNNQNEISITIVITVHWIGFILYSINVYLFLSKCFELIIACITYISLFFLMCAIHISSYVLITIHIEYTSTLHRNNSNEYSLYHTGTPPQLVIMVFVVFHTLRRVVQEQMYYSKELRNFRKI